MSSFCWGARSALIFGAALSVLYGQGPINPPALPANPPAGSGTFGTTSAPLPGGGINFPNPILNSWTALGPAPLTESGHASGRIAGIAVDPTDSTHIYVAAAGGGVWQTTDDGASYTPLTDAQSTLAMGAIAIAPGNRLKIYAGTGEANNSGDSDFGTGILVSNDGGASWSLSSGPSSVFNRLAISKISVDPTDPNTAYAAVGDFAENGLCCSGTGIYKTTDGGTTWVNVTAAASLDSSFPWSDVVVDPNSHMIVYAAHGDPFGDNTANGVYRSLDGGATWAQLSNAPHGSGIGRIALAVAPSASTSGSHVLYVAVATVLGGNSVLYEMLSSSNADGTTPTFTNLTNTPNFGGSGGQAWYDWIIGVDPANAANVYAAGALNYSNNTHHVIRSTDGGLSWTDITIVGGVQPHTDSHAMAFDSSSRLLLGNDGGIYRYDPSGPSWTNLNSSLNTIQFTGIGLHPTAAQTVAGGSQDNGTEVTTGSPNWNSTDGGDGGYTLFSQTNPSIVYGNHPIGSFGPTSFFRVSTNGGASWVSRTPSISNSGLFDFYAPIAVDSSNGNRVFLGGDALYESTNAAVSWTRHTSPATTAIDAIAVLPGGNSIYLATGTGGPSQVWLSTDDGSTWAARNLPVSAHVQEIDIDPNDNTGNTAVAVINTFNTTSQIYRTTNGGSTWTSINANLPLVPTWSAKIDTDTKKTIYVSNETGVYSSPSPYTAWTVYGTGLPHAQGVQLQLNSSLHELALATHGRGAWYTATPNPPTVVSFSVICGTGCTYNMIGSGRTHLPWQITGIQVVFSQPITSAGAASLTGVTASGLTGLGTNTLTWTFAGVTNGNLAAALASSGPNAIQTAGGALAGSNTSFALKILQGDISDDGVVNASDLTLVNNARSTTYNIFADINGDGLVDSTDVTIVRTKIGQTNP